MKRLSLLALPLLLTACATQTPMVHEVERLQMMKVDLNPALTLKRKIAVGRLSNETTYGKSLLGTGQGDRTSQKITDMFVQSLNNSQQFLVFERPDIDLIETEAAFSGLAGQLIGVDSLVLGSLTEFGRETTGQTGFLSSSKTQGATATVDLRLVDVHTGQVIDAVSGTGRATTSTSDVMGFGSVAGYDGSLNDQAIGMAVNAAVSKLAQRMLDKPWRADVLQIRGDQVFFSGGAAQGIKPGMRFKVIQLGEQLLSKQSGALIRLPGRELAEIEVRNSFGDSELTQGSMAQLVSGSLAGIPIGQLEVQEIRP